MEYGISEQEKWQRKSFGMCKHAFLLKAYEKWLSSSRDTNLFFIEKEAEEWASMSMRIKDESLFKPPATQPFRNDVIRAKVNSANIDRNFNTNNVPFN